VINYELLWSVGVLEYWSIGKTFKTQKNPHPIYQHSITPMLHYSDVVKAFIIPGFGLKRNEICRAQSA
jgi:hypothetical protein